MCVQVKVRTRWVDTTTDFQAEVGVPLVFDPADFRPGPKSCLCCVDIEATAKAAGLFAVLNRDGDWEVTYPQKGG